MKRPTKRLNSIRTQAETSCSTRRGRTCPPLSPHLRENHLTSAHTGFIRPRSTFQPHSNEIKTLFFCLGPSVLQESRGLLGELVSSLFLPPQSPTGVYTGFIKVQMDLGRPVTVRGGPKGAGGAVMEEAFYLPRGVINTLHISSSNTVRQVADTHTSTRLHSDDA